MSSMSTLDLLMKEYPGVPQEWLHPLVERFDDSSYDCMRKEAMLLGSMIGVVDEMKSLLISAAASMGQISEGDYVKVSELYNLLYSEYIHHLRVSDPPLWDSNVEPLDAWSSFFGKGKSHAA